MDSCSLATRVLMGGPRETYRTSRQAHRSGCSRDSKRAKVRGEPSPECKPRTVDHEDARVQGPARPVPQLLLTPPRARSLAPGTAHPYPTAAGLSMGFSGDDSGLEPPGLGQVCTWKHRCAAARLPDTGSTDVGVHTYPSVSPELPFPADLLEDLRELVPLLISLSSTRLGLGGGSCSACRSRRGLSWKRRVNGRVFRVLDQPLHGLRH